MSASLPQPSLPAAGEQNSEGAGAKRRGRPKGWVMPTFADLGALTVEDFSFVRAVVGGMEPVKAWKRFYANRHFDGKGEPLVPHGHEINAAARRLEQKIYEAAKQSSDKEIRTLAESISKEMPEDTVEEVVKVKVHRTFNEWVDTLEDPDEWGERELIAMYEAYVHDQQASEATSSPKQIPSPSPSPSPSPDEKSTDDTAHTEVTSRSLIIKAKVRAINYLQTVLASRPMPSDKTVIWLAPALRLALSKQGVHTMGDLAAFISRRGRHWHRGVEKLGPGRAARILAWLQEHQTSIGVIDLTGPQWSPKPQMRSRIAPLQATSTTTVVLVEDVTTGIHAPSPALPEKRMGIAPFECLHVPAHLDGSVGLFRSQTPNHYGARNDYEAVRIWLGTFLNAGKLRTFDAYRREIERFYLWCLLEARVPLSSVSLSHAMGYQAFLRSIPRTYITTRRLTRDDPNWRPWRGQLTPRNQAYALGIVSQFYNDAMRNAYVTGNPFASLKSPNAGRRVMDTTRSLSTQDLQWVRECLDALEDSNKSDLWAAIDRRTKLILHLALSTGMRLEEIATTTLLSARRTIVDGIEQDDEWLLEVCGKGKNTRYLPISGSIYQMIKAHHGDAAARLALSGGSAARRLQMFRERPPLICALRSPVGHETDLINDEALMSADNLALGRAGLYRTLKTFFRRESRQQVKKLEIKARGLKKKTIAALAKGDHKQAKTLEDEETSVIREIKSLERRENISTHWLRHTFAKAILAANPSDSGLKLTQQLLGHASINTTQLYITQDESEKIRAVRRINPLGL